MSNNRAAVAESVAAALSAGPLHDLKLQRLTQAIRGFSREQLLWSSGYLAGLAAAQVFPEAEPTPARTGTALASAAIRLTVLYASQTGNARSVAEALGRQAAARRLPHRVLSVADFRPRDLAKERLLLLVVSTQGEGDPPESARELYRFLFGKGAPRLKDLSFGVFGLGDSSYERFCQTGKDFDRRLEELGARRILERVDADLDFQTVSEGWFPGALEQVQSELAADAPAVAAVQTRDAEIVPLRAQAQIRHDRHNPYRATLLDNRPLTTPDAVAEVRHLALAIDPQAISYAPGDSLAVRFRNDPALIARVLEATGLDGQASVGLGGETLSLAEALATRLELTRLHPGVVAAWSRIADAPALADLARERAALRAYCQQRQLLDLALEYPARPQAETLAAALKPMQPRLYSIASSQAETEDEVHLTVSALRYRVNGQDRLGGASGFLAERLQEGEALDVYVAENRAFRLPEDGDTPIVLVGAGTGIAPFRAFLKQRAALGERGRNWLVFGNRHFQRDFLYQTDWLRLRKDGFLHRFSPAFSRDSTQKVYVQDRLRAEGAELWRWLAEGARIYVCGATVMEAAVRESLAAIARAHGGLTEDAALELPETLSQEGRYLRDTY